MIESKKLLHLACGAMYVARKNNVHYTRAVCSDRLPWFMKNRPYIVFYTMTLID
jgi:hypothetical protein